MERSESNPERALCETDVASAFYFSAFSLILLLTDHIVFLPIDTKKTTGID
jgi:hypothetical protein